jgi:hypothetical protein
MCETTTYARVHGEYESRILNTPQRVNLVSPSHLRRHQSMGHSWTGLHAELSSVRAHEKWVCIPTVHSGQSSSPKSVGVSATKASRRRTPEGNPWDFSTYPQGGRSPHGCHGVTDTRTRGSLKAGSTTTTARKHLLFPSLIG